MNVLWSRDGQLDNTPNRKFEPNHFVLQQFVDKEPVGKGNEKVSKSNAGEMSRNPKQAVLSVERKIDVEDSADVPGKKEEKTQESSRKPKQMTLWSFSKSMKADDVKKKSANEKEDLTDEKKKPKSFSE